MTYATANNAVERLVDDGVIAETTGRERNRVFRATEVMGIVERDARNLPDANDLVDIEQAWRPPDHGGTGG